MCLKLSLSALFPSSRASDWRTCSSTTTTWSMGKGADNCGEVCGLTVSCLSSCQQPTTDISWVKSAFPWQQIWSSSLVALWSVRAPGGLALLWGWRLRQCVVVSAALLLWFLWWVHALPCFRHGSFLVCRASVQSRNTSYTKHFTLPLA